MADALGGMSNGEDNVFYDAEHSAYDHENEQQVGSDEENHESICEDQNEHQVGSDKDNHEYICDDQIDQQVGSDEDNDNSSCDYETDEEYDESVFEVFDETAEVYSPASPRLPQANYKILNQNDIQQRQEEVISDITSILSVSRSEAVILLEHFNWSISKVNDEWFADEERVRKSVGLVQSGPEQEQVKGSLPKEIPCGICYEQHHVEQMKSTPTCAHFFCDTCWTGYIHTAIEDGPGCLTLRCAYPSCRAAIMEDMVLLLVSQEDRAKYTRYRLRGFVETKRTTRWCPAPGCEYAVSGPRAGSLEIVCKCSHNFCYDCLEEAHRPVDCKTVAKWLLKNGSESENINWLLVNSKGCPKCQRPIEKNEGCMHMTCNPPCRYEFCWFCLGIWSDHNGSVSTCNGYEQDVKEGRYDEAERKREITKRELKRYTHYYERWVGNESSRAKALGVLQQMEAVQLEKLSDKQCEPLPKLYFVTEAWLQIVECRRVLKWTYAYGYYITDQYDLSKRELFEYQQGEAEAHLERLHHCAEKELQEFFEKSTQKNFNEFRVRLLTLTSLASKYFATLVRDLENGRAENHSV